MAIGSVTADGLHRGGQDAVGIAHRDTDANTSDVDTQPAPSSGIVASGPIRQTVFWVRHLVSSGLSPRVRRPAPLRYLRLPCRSLGPCPPCRLLGRSPPRPVP